MKGQRFERGQALVLIILSVVAIFGFAALAVDMGRIYAERRRAQSAADSAALAAAYAVVSMEGVETASHSEIFDTANNTALTTAFENGYDNTNNNTITVNNPPDDDGHYEECRCEYIQVIIDSKVDPIFVQLLGRGSSEIRTIAIARARLTQPISTGNAIHALIESNEDGDGVEVDGDITFNILNGNVRSNKNGVKKGASGNVSVMNGDIITAKGWTNTDGVSADSIYKKEPLRVPVPPAPNCTHLSERTVDGTTLEPGRYNGIDLQANNHYVMKKGMYCVDGNFTINGNASVKGDGIFIVMQNGKMDINGSSTVKWKRPNDLVDGAGNQWGGMLIYSQSPNTGEISLSGNNDSFFVGTVFAPRGLCQYGGTNLTATTSAQLVCHQVRLHGTPDITIDYHIDQNYQMPPIVELVK